MTKYYRIILGQAHVYADECYRGGFVGVDYSFVQDLSGELTDTMPAFNQKFIPIFQATTPGSSKITAGLACGTTWTVAKGMKIGDVVVCPINSDSFRVGSVTGDYCYQTGGNLVHRRPVQWLPVTINYDEMSDGLQHSVRSIGAVCDLTKHTDELEKFLTGKGGASQGDGGNGDQSVFDMEKHLEDFLVKNWDRTHFSQEYQIYTDSNGKVGEQYQVDTGAIDLLAISKDKKKLLVIELKRGRATDEVVGQILRYMGYIKAVIAEVDQEVLGVIIALEDDSKLRRALTMTPFIEFYRYEISFKLVKV